MAPNDQLPQVQVYGPDVSDFEAAIQNVMHIQKFEQLDTQPTLETQIAEIKLNYATVGPKYGNKVGEIESIISREDYVLSDDTLVVGDETLSEDEFEVREETTYAGEGKMVETEHFLIIIQD